MRILLLLLPVSLMACASPEGGPGTPDATGGTPSESPTDTDSVGTTDTDTVGTTDTDTSGTGTTPTGTSVFHGVPPDVPIPLPTFAAVSHDETPRDRDDLLGHPTVMWFFPLAGTGG